MGKGSAPRPFSVTDDTFASNWEKTFGGAKGWRKRQIADREAEALGAGECPMCWADMEDIRVGSNEGRVRVVRRCTQCSHVDKEWQEDGGQP